jgi:integrase
LFLYREVLGIDLPWLDGINRPMNNRRIPSVLTKDELAGVWANMGGITARLARLLYGTGMHLMEGMRLRIKDVDFDRHVIIVRDAKGGKDRVVMLLRSLAPALRVQMLAARQAAQPARWMPCRSWGCRFLGVAFATYLVVSSSIFYWARHRLKPQSRPPSLPGGG